MITDFKCENCKKINTEKKEDKSHGQAEKEEKEDDEEEEDYIIATKTFLNLPPVLNLHLLRFYQSKSGHGSKNNKRFIRLLCIHLLLLLFFFLVYRNGKGFI